MGKVNFRLAVKNSRHPDSAQSAGKMPTVVAALNGGTIFNIAPGHQSTAVSNVGNDLSACSGHFDPVVYGGPKDAPANKDMTLDFSQRGEQPPKKKDVETDEDVNTPQIANCDSAIAGGTGISAKGAKEPGKGVFEKLPNANPHPTGWPNERRGGSGGVYPEATLSQNSMGHIHAWPGHITPDTSNRKNHQVGGKDSPVYFQSEDDMQSVKDGLKRHEWKDLEAGYPVHTHNFSDEYFSQTPSKVTNSHFGHAGRPGQRGGSAPGQGGGSLRSQYAGRPEAYKKANPKIGDRIRVVGGVDEGKAGVIINPREIPTDGRGVPQVGGGHYKPSDWKREHAIRYDDGKLGTMFKNYVVHERYYKDLRRGVRNAIFTTSTPTDYTSIIASIRNANPHPTGWPNERKAYSVGTKVRTDSGEIGEINHIHHSNDPDYPHQYKVTDLSANDPYKQTRLEGGNFIPHHRLMPVGDSDDVVEKHQTRIAQETLRMPDAMAGVMGGPTKEQAAAFLKSKVKNSQDPNNPGEETQLATSKDLDGNETPNPAAATQAATSEGTTGVNSDKKPTDKKGDGSDIQPEPLVRPEDKTVTHLPLDGTTDAIADAQKLNQEDDEEKKKQVKNSHYTKAIDTLRNGIELAGADADDILTDLVEDGLVNPKTTVIVMGGEEPDNDDDNTPDDGGGDSGDNDDEVLNTGYKKIINAIRMTIENDEDDKADKKKSKKSTTDKNKKTSDDPEKEKSSAAVLAWAKAKGMKELMPAEHGHILHKKTKHGRLAVMHVAHAGGNVWTRPLGLHADEQSARGHATVIAAAGNSKVKNMLGVVEYAQERLLNTWSDAARQASIEARKNQFHPESARATAWDKGVSFATQYLTSHKHTSETNQYGEGGLTKSAIAASDLAFTHPSYASHKSAADAHDAAMQANLHAAREKFPSGSNDSQERYGFEGAHNWMRDLHRKIADEKFPTRIVNGNPGHAGGNVWTRPLGLHADEQSARGHATVIAAAGNSKVKNMLGVVEYAQERLLNTWSDAARQASIEARKNQFHPESARATAWDKGVSFATQYLTSHKHTSETNQYGEGGLTKSAIAASDLAFTHPSYASHKSAADAHDAAMQANLHAAREKFPSGSNDSQERYGFEGAHNWMRDLHRKIADEKFPTRIVNGNPGHAGGNVWTRPLGLHADEQSARGHATVIAAAGNSKVKNMLGVVEYAQERLLNTWSDAARQASIEARKNQFHPESARATAWDKGVSFATQYLTSHKHTSETNQYGEGGLTKSAIAASDLAFTHPSYASHKSAADAHDAAMQANLHAAREKFPSGSNDSQERYGFEGAHNWMRDLHRKIADEKFPTRIVNAPQIKNSTTSAETQKVNATGSSATPSPTGMMSESEDTTKTGNEAASGVVPTNPLPKPEDEKTPKTVPQVENPKDVAVLNGKCIEIGLVKIANSSTFKMPDDGYIQLVPFGTHPHVSAGVNQIVNKASGEKMVEAFNNDKKGENFAGLLCDRDHASETGGPSEAAGWVDDLQVRNDGVYGHVRWTKTGEDLVSNGSYRMISPVFIRSECRSVPGENSLIPQRISSIALTNVPNMPMKPITK